MIAQFLNVLFAQLINCCKLLLLLLLKVKQPFYVYFKILQALCVSLYKIFPSPDFLTTSAKIIIRWTDK